MPIIIIGLSVATMLGMALVLSYFLGWANSAFYVETDPRIDAINAVLPGANCGGCGYIGCGEYAEAVVEGRADVDGCTVGGERCAQAVAGIVGVEVGDSLPNRPVVHCGAYYKNRLMRSDYQGELGCTTANLVTGVQGCSYGCLGFGDCIDACAFDAISVQNGLSIIDYNRCVGCGACAKACPRNIITMTPFAAERIVVVACSNLDSGKQVKMVCEVGCLGCKSCQRVSDLFKIENNLASVNQDAWEPGKMEDVQKACARCTRNRIVFVGKPSMKDMMAVADEVVPAVVHPDPKTTVDDTQWRG